MRATTLYVGLGPVVITLTSYLPSTKPAAPVLQAECRQAVCCAQDCSLLQEAGAAHQVKCPRCRRPPQAPGL